MKRFFNNILHEARETWTPVATASTFHENGFLTPEEFISAGDYLTEKWAFWTWQSASLGLGKDYLPEDKQYLKTIGVLCKHRFSDESNIEQKTVESDDWVTATQLQQASKSSQFTEHSLDSDVDLWEENIESTEDPATLVSLPNTEHVNWRFYDLHITYDNYYRTPRLWIIGYDYYRNFLTPAEIFDDISPEHSKATITRERHPYLQTMCLSVHPCNHATMLHNVTQKIGQHDIKRVLEVFLHVMTTVLPTADFLARGMV